MDEGGGEEGIQGFACLFCGVDESTEQSALHRLDFRVVDDLQT